MTGCLAVAGFFMGAVPVLADEPMFEIGRCDETDPWQLGSALNPVTDRPINAYRMTMPKDAAAPSEWPRGGSYAYGGDAANLRFGEVEVYRVTYFNPACHAVVVDGQPLGPDHLPEGGKVIEKDGSTALIWPEGWAVILRGVPLGVWRQGQAAQISGTAGNDRLEGTTGPDVMVPGGGSNQVAPGAGDDAIVYSSGALVVLNTPRNEGNDHLELGRFAVADLTLAADAADLLITTRDGVIRLQSQLATKGGQVEWVRLRDGARLTAEDMRRLIP